MIKKNIGLHYDNFDIEVWSEALKSGSDMKTGKEFVSFKQV